MVKAFFIALFCLSLTGCASILRGNTPQKPNPCEPRRSIAWGWLIAETILTGGVGVGIDFATGAIYNPPKNGAKLKRANQCNSKTE